MNTQPNPEYYTKNFANVQCLVKNTTPTAPIPNNNKLTPTPTCPWFRIIFTLDCIRKTSHYKQNLEVGENYPCSLQFHNHQWTWKALFWPLFLPKNWTHQTSYQMFVHRKSTLQLVTTRNQKKILWSLQNKIDQVKSNTPWNERESKTRVT